MDFQTLAADLKETKRLLKILDEFTSDIYKTMSEDIINNKSSLKAFEKRLLDLEKKQKK